MKKEAKSQAPVPFSDVRTHLCLSAGGWQCTVWWRRGRRWLCGMVEELCSCPLPVARLNKHGGRGGKSAGKQRDPHHVEQAAVPSGFFSRIRLTLPVLPSEFGCIGCISVLNIRLFVVNWIPFNVKHMKIEPEILLHWQMIASYKQSYYSKRNKIINYWLNSAALKDKRHVGQHPDFDFTI